MRFRWMGGVAVLACAAMLSCTRPNPDVCCATEQHCTALGIEGLRPCEEAGQVCNAGACVASECNTSRDCASPDAPVCIENICVGLCSQNSDCEGIPDRQLCDVDGVCVGCVTDVQCPSDQPVCGPGRACRACIADEECTNGVCVEADGICVPDEGVVFVSDSGQDAGSCTKASPCRSIQFAQGLVTQARRVVRILGGQYSVGSSTISLPAIVDGSNTTLTSSAVPMFVVAAGVVLEGVRIASTSFDSDMISVQAGGVLRLTHTAIENAGLRITSGSAHLSEVSLMNSSVNCTNGSLAVERSVVSRSSLEPSNCMLSVSSSRLGPRRTAGANPAINGSGLLKIENNLFLETVEGRSSMNVFGYDIGSTVRFNTFVNTSAVVSNGAAIFCAEGLDVTSNIFAYNSTSPITPCTARYSLFDAAGSPAAAASADNRSADASTFFKDRSAEDFHLQATSPAIGMGEPGLVTEDFDGNPRPLPIGALPDVGAYEAP